MGAPSLALSFVLTSGVASAAPVDVEPRADVPWSAVVLATPRGGAPTSCSDAAVAACVARGAQCTIASSSSGSLLTLEGPPDLEATMLGALKERDGSVLAELHGSARTRGPDAPTHTRASPHAPLGALQAGAGALSLRLAPGATLWGLEGAFLVLLVEDALKGAVPLAPGAAPVTLDAEGARLWIHAASTDDSTLRAVRAALDKLAARPPAPPMAEKLWQRARGQLAARDATVGARARARAHAWLASGSNVIEGAADGDAQLLAARVRSRVLSAAVVTVAPVKAPGAQAPASSPAQAAR